MVRIHHLPPLQNGHGHCGGTGETERVAAEIGADGLKGDSTEDAFARDSAVNSTVGAVPTIVPKDEEAVIPKQDQLLLRERKGWRGRSGRQIGFDQLDVVHIDVTILELDRLAGRGHDSFDRKTIVFRIFKHDHVTVLRSAKEIRPAVEHILVAVMQSRHHADSGDLHGLHEIMADEIITGRGQHREHQ